MTCAGTRRINCDEPTMVVVRVGDSKRGGGVTDGKSRSNVRGEMGEAGTEHAIYTGGSRSAGVMNDVVAEGDEGARLTTAEGVVLHKACTEETTGDSRQSTGGGGKSYLPSRERKCGCGANTY